MQKKWGAIAAALAVSLVLSFGLSSSAFAKNLQSGTPPGPHEDFGGKAEIVVADVPFVPGHERNQKLMLDIYSNPHQGLWPAVVMIHGGGWISGDKDMDNKVYISKVLAANGYVVFNANYRLIPEAYIKTQVEDSMAAVIWVKEHAKEYGADPERVGVAGGSAGGHIGALVAWASDDPFFVPTGNPKSQYNASVKAAALYYPVLDLDRTLKENGKWAAPLGRLLFTGRLDGPYKKYLQHLSPMNHVRPGIPPTLFLTGDADELNLYPQSVEFTQKLQALGVPSKLYTAPGKIHGFTWNYWEPESVQSAKEIVEFFDMYLKP
ncbi:MAG TPA: alpha/beta hydrolase fold domain-containing protein [bacterium]|nr:alpha/beta hydrolase fold domain-containing protein [bacterium]